MTPMLVTLLFRKPLGVDHTPHIKDQQHPPTHPAATPPCSLNIKLQPLSLLLGVGVTILVSRPTRNGEVINPTHDGVTNEMVPAVMKPKPRATGITPNLP